MSIYEKYILPRVTHKVCGLKPMMRQREKVIPEAVGKVLEIGIGSGLNLRYYDPTKVQYIIGVDPTPHKQALKNSFESIKIDHELILASAEHLPMEDNSIDTVVSTYAFCTIPDLTTTLSECRRVLKDEGTLIFIEHGASPDPRIRKTQDRVNPIWKKIAGGCHLNRDIPNILKETGFLVRNLEAMYLPGWKAATWNVWGSASIR